MPEGRQIEPTESRQHDPGFRRPDRSARMDQAERIQAPHRQRLQRILAALGQNRLSAEANSLSGFEPILKPGKPVVSAGILNRPPRRRTMSAGIDLDFPGAGFARKQRPQRQALADHPTHLPRRQEQIKQRQRQHHVGKQQQQIDAFDPTDDEERAASDQPPLALTRQHSAD